MPYASCMCLPCQPGGLSRKVLGKKACGPLISGSQTLQTVEGRQRKHIYLQENLWLSAVRHQTKRMIDISRESPWSTSLGLLPFPFMSLTKAAAERKGARRATRGTHYLSFIVRLGWCLYTLLLASFNTDMSCFCFCCNLVKSSSCLRLTASGCFTR